jgi:hypothetical protein
MSQINQSLDVDNNNHLANKENFTIIMDYSNENSMSLQNTKNLFFNNKAQDKEKEKEKEKDKDKEQDNKNINKNDNNANYHKISKKEEKEKKSGRNQYSSLNKNERKII